MISRTWNRSRTSNNVRTNQRDPCELWVKTNKQFHKRRDCISSDVEGIALCFAAIKVVKNQCQIMVYIINGDIWWKFDFC